MTDEQELNRLRAAATSHSIMVANLLDGACIRALKDVSLYAIYGVKISMEEIQDLKTSGLDPQTLQSRYTELVREAVEQTFNKIMSDLS